MQKLSLPFSWHPDVMIGREAHNLPVWDQSSVWWRVYGGQSAGKNCKGECQCEPHFARQFALQPWVCPSICHSECWKEWQCDTTLSQWVADRGANSRLKGKLAGKVRLTLTFSLAILFSTLPAIHSSSDAALISYGEVVRLSSNHHVWMSTEWQWESLHFLQSALLVWQVSTQSQRALALCPWMWASKWVTVWHQG